MTTTTKTRQRSKPSRRLSFYPGVPALVEMTITTGRKAETFSYWLEQIPADFGLGFEVKKLITDGGTVYHVNLDLQHERHTCDCKGAEKWGHCKHQEAILALIKAGKLSAEPLPVRSVANLDAVDAQSLEDAEASALDSL
jgi:hypothetical protein